MNQNQEEKYKFERKWTIWLDCPEYHETYADYMNKVKWYANIDKIYTFNTIQNFWGAYNNLDKVSDLTYKSEYFIFQNNIKPVWYDINNLDGGEIKFTLKKSAFPLIFQNQEDKKTLEISMDYLWSMIILSLLGENLENSENINGMSIKILKDIYIISIWVNKTNNDLNEKILKNLKKILEDENPGLEIDIQGMSFFKHSDFFKTY